MRFKLFFIPMVEAVLKSPIREENGTTVLTHFTRAYYVWARDAQDAAELVRHDVAEDATVVEMDSPSERDLNDVPNDLKSVITLDCGRGICWRSGRAFFSDDESG